MLPRRVRRKFPLPRDPQTINDTFSSSAIDIITSPGFPAWPFTFPPIWGKRKQNKQWFVTEIECYSNTSNFCSFRIFLLNSRIMITIFVHCNKKFLWNQELNTNLVLQECLKHLLLKKVHCTFIQTCLLRQRFSLVICSMFTRHL